MDINFDRVNYNFLVKKKQTNKQTNKHTLNDTNE